MGGGGGGGFNWPSQEEVRRAADAAQSSAAAGTFGVALAGELGQRLGEFNDRDVGLVARRLEDITDALSDDLECASDVLYGGSVSKNTYVNGLSDIDSLLVFSREELLGKSPDEVLAEVADIVQEKLRGMATVSAGRLAVTIEYPDGMIIQCLPAIRLKNKLRIASLNAPGTWSSIDPEKFRGALTKRNQECGSKLVPTIKLAKAINATFPEQLQLSGYHIEARAIQVFKGYQGEKTTAAMLPYFFEKCAETVLRPIKDRTGQSIHVDDDLGPTNSERRRQVSQLLARVHRRMRNATASGDLAQWKAVFGD